MGEKTLPTIWTLKEAADYLKVEEDVVLRELECGKLHGFKAGESWRCSDEDLLNYIRGTKGDRDEKQERTDVQPVSVQPVVETASGFTEVDPITFHWPQKGGGSYDEYYGKCYETTRLIDGRHYTFRIGFGEREVAGQERCRVTIWIGGRAIVEFAGSNDFEADGMLAGVIKLPDGSQLSPYQKVPSEYTGFKIARYNSVVRGRRASSNMAVVVHKDDLESMLKHAIIRARWKELV